MDKYPYKVMEKLDSILKDAESNSWMFSRTPGKDFTRRRKLPFHRLAKTLIGMAGNSLSHVMLDCFHFSRNTPTVSALVQQRAKLLPESMALIFSQVVKAFPCRKLCNGYRLITCDGSDLHCPVNPFEKDSFIQTDEKGHGYNLLHLNVLYDVYNKRYADAIIQPRNCLDEIGAFTSMIDRFPADDAPDKVIFTADRGYESYNVMAHIVEKGMRFLIRVKDPGSSGILCKLNLSVNTEFDKPFHIEITRSRTKDVLDNPDLYRSITKSCRFDFCNPRHRRFYPLDFRVVAVELSPGSFEYLLTNLDASSFPPDKLKQLYHLRWSVETSFRDLKYTIGLSGFHSKKAGFIAQEVFARLILYNLCELVVAHAAVFNRSDSYVYQLNFSAAVHIFRRLFFLAPNESPPDVVALIRSHLLPVRPNRSNPRKVKCRSAVPFIYRIA